VPIFAIFEEASRTRALLAAAVPIEIPVNADIRIDEPASKYVLELTMGPASAPENVILFMPDMLDAPSNINALLAAAVPGVILSMSPKFLPANIDRYNRSASLLVMPSPDSNADELKAGELKLGARYSIPVAMLFLVYSCVYYFERNQIA
jgi:hypothetical protein